MNDTLATTIDLLLILGATLRLTRLAVVDDLGVWWLQDPITRWAVSREGSTVTYEDGSYAADPDRGWRNKLAEGTTCGFCIGFWIGCLVIGSWLIASHTDTLTFAWRIGALAFTLNYLAGHISGRMD